MRVVVLSMLSILRTAILSRPLGYLFNLAGVGRVSLIAVASVVPAVFLVVGNHCVWSSQQ